MKAKKKSFFNKNKINICTALVIILYFIFLILHFSPAISTPDANGYFAQARYIAEDGKTGFLPEHFLQYIGPHWYVSNNGFYYATFPPGFPMLVAIFYKLFGPFIALLLNPILASLSLVALFLFVKELLGEKFGLIAVLLMAVNPFANEHALFGDSHTSLIFFMLWALFFIFRWIKTGKFIWVVLGGIFAGFIPTIRYAEVLLTIAIVSFATICFWKKKISLKPFIVFLASTAFPIAFLLIHNQLAFGAFWRTGYAADASIHFSIAYIIPHFIPYIMQLILSGAGLLFITGLAGIIFLIRKKDTRIYGILFLLLTLPITLLYMAYYWEVDPQSMRFLLPTFFIYAIATLWLLKIISEKRYEIAKSLAIFLIIVTLLWGITESLPKMQKLKMDNEILAYITSEANQYIEPGSIIISNEAINQNLDFIGRWRLVDAYLLHKWIEKEKNNELSKKRLKNIGLEKYSGLNESGFYQQFASDIWSWPRKQNKVYLIIYEEDIQLLRLRLSENYEFNIIKRIDMPNLIGLGPRLQPDIFKSENKKPGQMPNQIFDLPLNGKPLFIVEWTKKP